LEAVGVAQFDVGSLFLFLEAPPHAIPAADQPTGLDRVTLRHGSSSVRSHPQSVLLGQAELLLQVLNGLVVAV